MTSEQLWRVASHWCCGLSADMGSILTEGDGSVTTNGVTCGKTIPAASPYSSNLDAFHWLRMRRVGVVWKGWWWGLWSIVSWTAEPHSRWMGIVIWISMAHQNTFSRRGGLWIHGGNGMRYAQPLAARLPLHTPRVDLFKNTLQISDNILGLILIKRKRYCIFIHE